MRLLLSLLLVPLALVAACSPQAAGSAAPTATDAAAALPKHPVSGLDVIPLTAVLEDGRRHEFRVEVARTGQEQARGLMFRTEMGPDEGMLFPYSPPRTVSFWMRNTVLSLDLIFIGPDRRVINIAANAVPYSERSLWSRGPVIAVLELNGGRAAELGIVPGTRIEW